MGYIKFFIIIIILLLLSKVDWLQLVSKWFSFYKYPSIVTSCSMHSIVTTFRGADIKVEVANICAAMDTLIDQDDGSNDLPRPRRSVLSECF